MSEAQVKDINMFKDKLEIICYLEWIGELF